MQRIRKPRIRIAKGTRGKFWICGRTSSVDATTVVGVGDSPKEAFDKLIQATMSRTISVIKKEKK